MNSNFNSSTAENYNTTCCMQCMLVSQLASSQILYWVVSDLLGRPRVVMNLTYRRIGYLSTGAYRINSKIQVLKCQGCLKARFCQPRPIEIVTCARGKLYSFYRQLASSLLSRSQASQLFDSYRSERSNIKAVLM